MSVAERQSRWFLALYAGAAAGGAAAYIPFLTILLPARVSALAGPDVVTWLAYLSFAGALAASAANIGFGWLSDAAGCRRPWIAAGVLVSGSALIAFGHARGLADLLALMILWQCGLNMMLAPLAAWGGDHVPDQQKGLLGGLLAIAPAVGAAASIAVTHPVLAANADERLALVAAAVAALVLPAVLFARPILLPQPTAAPSAPSAPRWQWPIASPILRKMWAARLLVQIAEAALFAYVYVWFVSLDPRLDDSATARIFGLVLAAAVPLTLTAGRWSDRRDRPVMPLRIAALVAAAGLAAMAGATGAGSAAAAVAGYMLFSLCAAMFLSLHSAQTLRLLPNPARRGRDLGLFNLTNTIPSLIMPWLTLALVPSFGFAGLFAVLAVTAAAAAAVLFSVPRIGLAVERGGALPS